MSCANDFGGGTFVHQLDARVRLFCGVLLALAVALSARVLFACCWLGLGLAVGAAARLNARALLRRLRHLNAFMLFLWAVLPWSVEGKTWCALGPLTLTEEGVRLAMNITLKGNAIALLCTALVSTIAPQRLGWALKGLGLPDKLAYLVALTIRHTDVVHEEYGRLRRTMKARAFHPRFSMHTLRTIGYAVGELLVRGMERGERVVAAMKCRAFDGRFRTLDAPLIGWREAVCVAATVLCAGTLFVLERV